MSATLRLDKFQLLWFLQGGICGSHIRWDIYSTFVNDVFPQLSESERECIYTYAKRDFSEMFERKPDATESWLFRQLLARFNPANQYVVTLKDGKKKEIADNAYSWNGKYYIGWQRYCGEEYIIKVEQKPFGKCANEWCSKRDCCLRYATRESGDTIADGLDHNFTCDKCDAMIDYKETRNKAAQGDINCSVV